MKIEYVTDPPLLPGLRCVHCRGKVRVVRTALGTKSEFAVVIAEPVTWVVLAVAGALGYLW